MIQKIKKIKKESRQSVFFSIFLGILLFVVSWFLITSNLKINQRRAELNSQIESLKKEIQNLEQKKRELEAKISESASESYLEKEARERFNLKKPGEEVVSIIPPEEKEETPKTEKNLWQTILEKLKF